jgi:hypothetical protein
MAKKKQTKKDSKIAGRFWSNISDGAKNLMDDVNSGMNATYGNLKGISKRKSKRKKDPWERPD